MTIISNPISDLNGLKRVCFVAQIAYMDFTINEAKIKYLVDIPEIGITKEYWAHISDAKTVDSSGKLITKEYTDSKFVAPEPMPVDTTEEQLKEEYYQSELAKGTPQFTFWWTVANQLSLNDALIESIKMLDEEGFFS